MHVDSVCVIPVGASRGRHTAGDVRRTCGCVKAAGRQVFPSAECEKERRDCEETSRHEGDVGGARESEAIVQCGPSACTHTHTVGAGLNNQSCLMSLA